MEHLNLITDCLIALYLNNIVVIDDKEETYIPKLIKDCVESIPVAQAQGDLDYSNDSVESLRSIIINMLGNRESSYYKYDFLYSKLKQTNSRNPHVYEAIDSVVKKAHDQTIDEVKGTLYAFVGSIRKTINERVIKRKIRDFAFNKTNLTDVDWNFELQKLYEEVSPLVTTDGGTNILKESFICSSVNFDDPETVSSALSLAAKMCDPETSIKTPYKLLNKMMGELGGLPRPGIITVAACTHNFKTGMLSELLMGIPTFNTPNLINKDKKPLILFLSLENELPTNIAQMYIMFKERETGIKVPAARTIAKFRDEPETLKEATEYITNKLQVNGFKVIILRINPSECDYTKLFALLDHYELQGYEIVTLFMDYLLMMSKKGCDMPAGTGSDSRDLMRRVRNYIMPRHIPLITPLQLSTTAKELRRQILQSEGSDGTAFVRELQRSNMYDSCRSLEQEIDLELYLDIIVIQGKKFLVIGRGKHRGLLVETPDSHKICIIPFQDIGGLMPDMHLEESVIHGYATVRDAQSNMGGVNATMDW